MDINGFLCSCLFNCSHPQHRRKTDEILTGRLCRIN
jgi:hypothetical protein